MLATYAQRPEPGRAQRARWHRGEARRHRAMHKNDSTLRNQVNLALQDIASTGEYDPIYDKWFGPSYGARAPAGKDRGLAEWMTTTASTSSVAI